MFYAQTRIRNGRLVTFAALVIASTALLTPLAPSASAQSQRPGAAPSETTTQNEQIAELRASLARLEAQLLRDRRHGGAGKGPGMRGKGGKGSGGKGGMGGMGSGGKGGMGGGKGGMGGGMKGGGGKGGGTGTAAMGAMTGSAAQQASLPGFPGASHLYHIGADDFFLNHDEHITLSVEQRAALSRIREQAQLEAATFERRLAELEQELWVLTSSDQPDIEKIEKKIRQIERMRSDQRIAYIRAVGRAAQKLTEAQRGVLVGDMPASTSMEPADNPHQHEAP